MRSFSYLSIDVFNLYCLMYQIDMDKLAAFLPLHLLAVLVSSDRDEELFRYLLRGIRFLHSLCDLASRHAKMEQVTFSNACQSFGLFC
jgi:hypothetical protein